MGAHWFGYVPDNASGWHICKTRQPAGLSLSADLRMNVHCEKLATFHQFWIAACLVILDDKQEPALAEDVLRVDDAGGLFIDSDERR